ncbi:MAG: hypothetical protein IJ228_00280 [Succinivibrio sp.]|nr:hypothetical protein [Succinivibrio sp.]
MTIPAKLPNPSRYCKDEVMTELDWEHYFQLRKDLDHFVSAEDKARLHDLAMTSSMQNDQDTYDKVHKIMPLLPALAISGKNFMGLKSVQNFNLYDAKLKYPDEF